MHIANPFFDFLFAPLLVCSRSVSFALNCTIQFKFTFIALFTDAPFKAALERSALAADINLGKTNFTTRDESGEACRG